MSDELLSMFFDDEFVPHAYLDAFFSNDLNSTNLKNSSNIQSLQHRSSLLLSNLDFLTNELTNDLESKIDKLYNSNSIISYSYNNTNNNETSTSKLKPTSRLEYYIDSLLISIQSLNEIIESIQHKINTIKSNSTTTSETVQTLINLSISKTNLFKVLNFLELIKSIVDISHDDTTTSSIPTTNKFAPTTSSKTAYSNTPEIIITPTEFQNSLNILKDTIQEQFLLKSAKELENQIDLEFLSKVNNFINLLPIFKNLNTSGSGFFNIYNDFVKKISKSKQDYLNGKKIDDYEDDELFKQVLN